MEILAAEGSNPALSKIYLIGVRPVPSGPSGCPIQ